MLVTSSMFLLTLHCDKLPCWQTGTCGRQEEVVARTQNYQEVLKIVYHSLEIGEPGLQKKTCKDVSRHLFGTSLVMLVQGHFGCLQLPLCLSLGVQCVPCAFREWSLSRQACPQFIHCYICFNLETLKTTEVGL